MARTLEERIALACKLASEFPLETLHDRAAIDAASASAIPAQCFQTAEVRRFGRRHHAALQELRALNPELHFLLFDAHQRDRYMAEHWGDQPIGALYRRARFGAMRADIFRYCVVFERGGFYLDINKLVVAPLLTFLGAEDRGLICFENNWCQLPAPPQAAQRLQHSSRYVVQWGFGFAPRHPILEAMINNICSYAPSYMGTSFAEPSEAIRSLTGPGLFTQTVRHYFEHNVGAEICQAGIDFNQSLRSPAGKQVMYLQRPHYKDARDERIFSLEDQG